MNFQSIRNGAQSAGSAVVLQFPGKYRHDLLVKRCAELNTNPKEVAVKADVARGTVTDALSGECKKIDTLYSICQALGLKWEYLFMFDDFPYRKAVLGGAASGR